MNTHRCQTNWDIVDNTKGLIIRNGKWEHDISNMSYLYSSNENQIDMLLDCDNGMLSYSIVDDNVSNRKYTFK